MTDPNSEAAQLAATFQKALSAHQSGQLSRAQALYEHILSQQPAHGDALSLLGVIAIQKNDPRLAVRLIGKAIEINPNNIAAYSNRGIALQALMRMDEALDDFNRAIALKADYAEAHYNRGTALQALRRPQEALASYDQAIRIKSDYAEAHGNRAVLLDEFGHLEEALVSYDRAIRINPDYATAHSNRGNTLQKLKRHEEALESYRKATQIQPDYAEAYSNQGNALLGMARFDEALGSYNHALKVNPNYAEAFYNRGVALHDLERLDAALDSYDRAVAIRPDYAEALYNRGNTLQKLKRPDEALDSYDRALRSRPDYAEAHGNRGITLQSLKRLDEALESYNRAISIKPDYADAYSNRGNTLHDLKRLNDALESYDRALGINPDYAEAHYNRGIALQDLKRWDEALAGYVRAIEIMPEYAEAHCNRGAVLHELGQLEAALDSFDRAIEITPDYADAYNNRGLALQGLRRLDEARASFERAFSIRPDSAEIRWNLSLLDLLTGNLAAGWKGYEARWKNEKLGYDERKLAQPLWLGQDSVAGKTILLHSEQGLGDTLQFSRYAELVANSGATVILEAPRPLIAVLASLKGVTYLAAEGDPLPDFDLHTPLLSLPLAFGTKLGTIPSQASYLSADPGKVAEWAAILGKRTRPRVGLVWSGSTVHKNDRNRSIHLGDIVGGLPDRFQYVSLQKELRTFDHAPMTGRGDILHFGDRLNDFADTAALCALMDIVISVDTSVAHLAGALGKEVWLLLPYVPDWRWLLDRDDSPWYPSMKLLRQPQAGDWQSVMEQVRQKLEARNIADALE